MFENLNNPNPSNRQSVDDIFAETDQAGGGQSHFNNSEITTRRVGLAASTSPAPAPVFEAEKEEKGSGKGFKIAVIGMVVVIVGLLGFLAYSKFFKAPVVEQPVINPTPKVNVPQEPAATVTGTATTTNEQPAFVTEIPAATNSTTPNIDEVDISTSSDAIILTLDADNDGLSDDEEIIAKTNINLVDTDGDGLSDYEEVKIYITNPLVVDTDGDTYSDGEEVKNGYNPNGAGKLPGNIIR
jgi:hypothetical protein